MRVLIAGCGDVGNILASLLLQNGHQVFGLKRNIPSLQEGVQAIQADLTRPSTLRNLPEDIDLLVFMPTPASRDQAAYEAIFLEGWNNLWASLRQKPTRTLMVSSTAVFGQSDGRQVNEETPPDPTRFNGKILQQMEQLGRDSSENLIVARVAGIYGPGREGMIRLAATEGLEIQQTPPLFTNRIHIDDVAAALLHLLFMEQAQDLYLVSDDLPVARYEVVSWLAGRLGKPVPKGLTDQKAAAGKRIDNQRLRSSGFSLTYPDYRAGYDSVLKQRSTNELSK
jgi:nucleoside-diphosphate-sugar epimerase